MSSEVKLPSDGVALDAIVTSPYDLPVNKIVVAQDPPEEDAAAGTPEDAPTEEGPSEEDLLTEIENSPGVQWKKYLRPILKIIKDTKLKVPIELHNSYATGIDEDTFLGFHIIGTVHFLEEIPADIAAALQGAPLQYEASITPDGAIGDVSLNYATVGDNYEPTYRVNRNVSAN